MPDKQIGDKYSKMSEIPGMKVEHLQALVIDFGEQRNWSGVYTSALNMVLALLNECGELAEQVMFLPHEECELEETKVINIGHETADVLIYLLHLARATGAAHALDELRLSPAPKIAKV